MNKNTTGAIAVIAGALLVPLGAGLAADRPLWLTMVLMVGALVITLLVLRGWYDHREQAELRAETEYRRQMAAQQAPPPPPPPAPAPPPSHEVSSGSLPSLLDGIPFRFGCTVHWGPATARPFDSHTDQAAIAAAAVVQRAQQISRMHHPEDDTVLHALAASLGQPATSPDGLLSVWATDVKAGVGQEHREHLRTLDALRRQQQVQERQIEHQRMMRAYLGDEVLTSVGSTVVWWLARTDENVRETVDLIGTLARLSAAANNAEVDELFRHLLPEHLREPAPAPAFFTPPFSPPEPVFTVEDVEQVAEPQAVHADLLPDPEDADNGLFGHQLADLVEQHGHSDKAQRVRESYRTIDADEPENGTNSSHAQGAFFDGDPGTPEPDENRDWGAGG